MSLEYQSKLKVNKVDVYKSIGLAQRLGVSTAPALAFVYRGQVVERFEGKEEVLDVTALKGRSTASWKRAGRGRVSPKGHDRLAPP